MGNTPSEPGQPTPPNVHKCPLCLKELEPTEWVAGKGYVVRFLNCPDRCALAAGDPDRAAAESPDSKTEALSRTPEQNS